MSERTLRRRLSKNRIEGAERDDSGQWKIPTDWLDSEFTPLRRRDDVAPAPGVDARSPERPADPDANVVIDLRDGAGGEADIDLNDASIASGLAAALSDFSGLTNRVIEAEVTAALATHESDHLNDRVRRLQSDLDAERARAERLRHDLAEAENALMLDRDRRARTERDLAAMSAKAKAASKSHRGEMERLRATNSQNATRLAALEAFIGKRQRSKFNRFLEQK